MRETGLALGALLLASCTMVPEARQTAPTSGAAAPAVPVAMRPSPAASSAVVPMLHIPDQLRQGDLARIVSTAPLAGVSLNGKAIPFMPREFLIGFGRDAAPTAQLEARYQNGTVERRTLAVAPRSWAIQSLPTLRKGTDPTPEFLRRRKIELARINAARAKQVESDGWRQRLLWPVTGRISGVFGAQRIYAGEPGSPHSGVDVARPTGTPVVAPADGVVILAADAPFTLEGNLLMIGHGMGLDSAFLHLSRIDVKEGERVTRGQTVGAIGATGRTTGPHLHWAMKWTSERIDPQAAAGPMPGS